MDAVRCPRAVCRARGFVFPILSVLSIVLGMALFTPVADAQQIRIVAMGDSDTSGRGVATAGSYPYQLETLLRERGHDVRIVNAGEPGEASFQGLDKLGHTVPAGTAIALIQYGTSDIKVAMTPQQIGETLRKIVADLARRGVKVVLLHARPPAPHQIPQGYDMAAYHALFGAIARETGSAYYRFSQGLPPPGQDSEGKFYQRDGHLTAAGYAVVAQGLAPIVERMLAKN